MFDGPFRESIIGRAQKNVLLQISIHSLRTWAEDKKHGKVDDRPYGGGAGMLLQPEPIYRAIKQLSRGAKKKPWVVFVSPQGMVLNQKMAGDLAKKKYLLLICGHYEGIDERAMKFVDQEVSIGDYVLTGGELPAMVLVDTVARLVPGVVGDPASIENESFSKDLLDHPHYTRPRVWRKMKVPDVLLSGNHADIERWRAKQSQLATKRKRPALLRQGPRT